MLRMRTMAEAYEELKKADPNTAITKSYVRRLIVSGKVPSIKVGKKYLVNMDHLETYLCNPNLSENEIAQKYMEKYGQIRAVSE